MITVALIGPDGAGKTTVAKRVVDTLDVPVKYLYMGINLEASESMAPTARLVHAVRKLLKRPAQHGPPAHDDGKVATKPRFSLWRSIKSALRLMNQLSDESFRQMVVWTWQRGHVVIFDRHYYFDYYATDIKPTNGYRPLARRIHGYWLQHWYPRPQLVIYLDAPAAVMFARKGEGTIELLERRRQGYLAIGANLPHFVVVNSDQDIDQVVADVCHAIRTFDHTTPARRTSEAVTA